MNTPLIAYLAGIIDGEGSVGTFGKKKPIFTIEVKMTAEPIIDLLLNTFGGTKVFRPREKAHYKDQWRWRVKGKRAETVYQTLFPFLRLKVI
jgi:hypothetical protein